MPRRKKVAKFSLLSVFTALEATKPKPIVHIETHNETMATGCIDYVDRHFNVTLTNATITYPPKLHGIRKKTERKQQDAQQVVVQKTDRTLFRGQQIRFIQLPDDLDIAKCMTEARQRAERANKQYNRPKKQQQVKK